MGFVFTIVAAFCLWIVVWAMDVKAIDSFMIALVIMIIGLTVKMLSPFKPSNRQ